MKTKTGTERFIDLTISRTRYIEAGQGDNHLFLLHGQGLTTSADSYQFVIDDLAREFHVYALDLLGYGKGTRTLFEGPTFDMTVDHIREFMDTMGIDQANMVGHSAGGWIAALLAYESPDRFKKLVLLCAAGLNAEISPTVLDQKLPTDEQSAAAPFLRMALDTANIRPDRVKALALSDLEMARQPGAQNSLDAILRQMTTPEVRKRYLLQRRLPFIKVPTMVIWGQGDWMDPYPTWTEEYHRLEGNLIKSSKPWVIPGAKYLMMPTGHGPIWEAPEALSKILIEFLNG